MSRWAALLTYRGIENPMLIPSISFFIRPICEMIEDGRERDGKNYPRDIKLTSIIVTSGLGSETPANQNCATPHLQEISNRTPECRRTSATAECQPSVPGSATRTLDSLLLFSRPAMTFGEANWATPISMLGAGRIAASCMEWSCLPEPDYEG